MFFHQIYTENDPPVSAHKVMEMFTSANTHIVHVCSNFLSSKVR